MPLLTFLPVRYTCTRIDSLLTRVETLTLKEDLAVNLTALRASIHSLQAQSAELDAEKVAAEKELERVIRRWQHRRSRAKRVFCRVTRFLGFEARQCTVKNPASELGSSGSGEHVPGKRPSRRYAFPFVEQCGVWH